MFLGVSELLKYSTKRTVDLLKQELEIRLSELEEAWHFSSLERIFIEKRIYRDIEEEETWEGVITAIHNGLKPYIKHLRRPVTDDDVVRLTEIRIKRISKFDLGKAEEEIARLEGEIEEVKNHLNNLIDYAVAYFKRIKDKFGKGKERKTELRKFDHIQARKVIVANKKLFVDPVEGFIGWDRKIGDGEAVSECSDIDDIIVFREDGVMQVVRIAEKKFVGKNIIFAGVWKKNDDRTIYHLIYRDGKDGGASFMKRCAVSSITREKEYHLTRGVAGSKVLYFSVNPDGRKEVVTVHLKPRPNLRRTKLDLDFSELQIKGRAAGGNRVTREKILKVVQKEVGGSTLDSKEIWFDDVVRRLNDEGRGRSLGNFGGNDRILTIYQSGHYRLTSFDLSTHFEDDLMHIEKWHPEKPINAVYFDGEKGIHFVKRFQCESGSDKPVLFISEHDKSRLEFASTFKHPVVVMQLDRKDKGSGKWVEELVDLSQFIDVKGQKAQGNQLTKESVKKVFLHEESSEDWLPEDFAKPMDDDATETDNESSESLNLDEPVSAEKPVLPPKKVEDVPFEITNMDDDIPDDRIEDDGQITLF